ncbi:MAG: DUF2752 domain-containing protein [Phycisphaerales bacterium]|nr:MAG: DUF2752 domain-containing protein [Phycisphaerales bacterium]
MTAYDITALQDSRPGAGLSAPGFGAAGHVTVLLFCSTILACAAALTPGEEGLTLLGYRWPFYCRLHETLGIKCALCGMSRSFCALAHGDAEGGLQFHRLGPLVFVLFCLQIPYRLYALAIRSRPVHTKLVRFHIGLVTLASAAVFVNWIVYLGGLLL